MKFQSKTESLREEIKYMQSIGCDKLAELLIDDLDEETLKWTASYVAKDYSQEARDKARAKYGMKDQ